MLGTDAGLTAEHLVKANPKRRWFQIGRWTPLALMLVLSVDPSQRTCGPEEQRFVEHRPRDFPIAESLEVTEFISAAQLSYERGGAELLLDEARK
ncbi:MAG: hypothetical protein MUF25_28325 [Pirellulaceae bacterium]|nr:hypothetical protein [Pirellulaceae bacterium]